MPDPNRCQTLTLNTADGHALSAYRAAPRGTPRGGLVVLHEIFGVNAHIREVCDGYAERGFVAIAPALFDRVQPGVALDYDQASVAQGRALRAAIAVETTLLDVQAAIDAAHEGGATAVLGYCWGGTLAFLSATRLAGVSCAVAYYGAQTLPFASEQIRVPVLMHFGTQDPRISPADIATIRRHNPAIEVHSFPADHGFNCDHRNEWHAPSAARALALTLAFLDRNLAVTSPAPDVAGAPPTKAP